MATRRPTIFWAIDCRVKTYLLLNRYAVGNHVNSIQPSQFTARGRHQSRWDKKTQKYIRTIKKIENNYFAIRLELDEWSRESTANQTQLRLADLASSKGTPLKQIRSIFRWLIIFILNHWGGTWAGRSPLDHNKLPDTSLDTKDGGTKSAKSRSDGKWTLSWPDLNPSSGI